MIAVSNYRLELGKQRRQTGCVGCRRGQAKKEQHPEQVFGLIKERRFWGSQRGPNQGENAMRIQWPTHIKVLMGTPKPAISDVMVGEGVMQPSERKDGEPTSSTNSHSPRGAMRATSSSVHSTTRGSINSIALDSNHGRRNCRYCLRSGGLSDSGIIRGASARLGVLVLAR